MGKKLHWCNVIVPIELCVEDPNNQNQIAEELAAVLPLLTKGYLFDKAELMEYDIDDVDIEDPGCLGARDG
jgi:hypothetical protein